MDNNFFDFKDYGKFNTPGEYKRAIERHDVRMPLQFFIAVSAIMRKRRLSFGEACQLLEQKGYLIWQGKAAIYDLRGDSLWRDKPEGGNNNDDDQK